MYYDKQFQCNLYFPIVAFNHEQMKKYITEGYFLTQRSNFNKITDWLMNLLEVSHCFA